jgi:hypothetical protein
MPNVKTGIANLKVTDLDSAPPVPACSILFRLLPADKVRKILKKKNLILGFVIIAPIQLIQL